MRIGIIGDGIVGTAIAATLAKNRPSLEITLIDDGRPFKTSRAGQGYLWSIHRFDDAVGLETSVMAKNAWRDLLGDGDGDGVDGQPLLKKTGSLLIAPNRDASALNDYYQRARNSPHLPNLQFLSDASTHNFLLRPGEFHGVYSPDDYTCNPLELIEFLRTKFRLETDHRTVTDLRSELRTRTAAGGGDPSDSGFDCVICCAGPWINDLEDVNLKPIRGLLLEAGVGDALEDAMPSTSTYKTDGNEEVVKALEQESKLVPMMEFGYGTQGIHFTLSSRDGALLVGASREAVGFSTTDLEILEEAILRHADKFVVSGGIGPVLARRLGFRPACFDQKPKTGRNYWIENSASDHRILLVYGFEGQGVLYAPLAAMDVLNTFFSF